MEGIYLGSHSQPQKAGGGVGGGRGAGPGMSNEMGRGKQLCLRQNFPLVMCPAA